MPGKHHQMPGRDLVSRNKFGLPNMFLASDKGHIHFHIAVRSIPLPSNFDIVRPRQRQNRTRLLRNKLPSFSDPPKLQNQNTKIIYWL